MNNNIIYRPQYPYWQTIRRTMPDRSYIGHGPSSSIIVFTNRNLCDPVIDKIRSSRDYRCLKVKKSDDYFLQFEQVKKDPNKNIVHGFEDDGLEIMTYSHSFVVNMVAHYNLHKIDIVERVVDVASNRMRLCVVESIRPTKKKLRPKDAADRLDAVYMLSPYGVDNN